MSKIKLFDLDESEDSKREFIDKDLPQPYKGALRWVMLGPSTSGKSTLIKNILFNDKWGYNKYFDEFYIFCGSIDDCQEMRTFRTKFHMDKRMRIIQKFNDEEVKSLINQIEEENSQLGTPLKCLFVFDDQICNNLSSSHKLNTLDEIFIRGRHAAISAIISTQKYTSLNSNVRMLNLKYLTIFEGTNEGDLVNVSKEHPLPGSNAKQTLATLKAGLNDKYSNVTIDYLANKEGRLKQQL
jgi:hypothetical protein